MKWNFLTPALKHLLYVFYKNVLLGGNLQSLKNKNFLYIRKSNFLAPALEKNIYFSKKLLYLASFIRIITKNCLCRR